MNGLHQVKRWLSVGMGGLLYANLMAGGTAHAALVPWVGYANYRAAPGADGYEDSVGPFSSYDFANDGVVLVQPTLVQNTNAMTVGDIYQGSYESYVVAHDDGQGTLVPSPNLNANGGYELTVAATFTEQVTSIDSTTGTAVFNVTGGNANLYFDTNPNHNFTTDSGFTDGASILGGTVTGGAGTYLPSPGVGFNSFNLSIGTLGYDHNVYTPADIGGGSGIFTLQINPGGVTSGVSAVLGQAVQQGDTLLQADGSLNLLAVPLPGAIWGLGSAMLGLVAWGRRGQGRPRAV